ncbi:DUF4129 domain-containing protein [Glycomyces sp. NPDC046736]|uniref:DUF4129 domain-containing protein n=1 Tax=Glycomyces sp. NPDC046736 TaxID=3155615 RepID=UPI00340575CF
MAHPDRPSRGRLWSPVLLVVAALLVVGIAAQGAGVEWGESSLPEGLGGTMEPPPLTEEEFELPTRAEFDQTQEDFTIPSWVTWLVLGVLVGIPALLILIFLARRLVDWLLGADPDGGKEDPEAQYLHRDIALVEDAVAAALAEVDLGDDPRTAIIACWVHFERAAAAVGIEREHSDTPADLVRRLLERHDLDGRALTRLSEAYLRARYSPHDVDETDRDRAREALVALSAQLGDSAKAAR